MSGNEAIFNNGAQPRERRPRLKGAPEGGAIFGALIGNLLFPGIGGIIGGGLAGAAITSGGPMAFEAAVRQMTEEVGCAFVSLNHYGPFKVVLTFGFQGGYWSLPTQADSSLTWTQFDLEDWLFGDLKQNLYTWLGGRQWT